ncbi:metallophosphoesterase family protein [Roseibacillus persicicus]|uniref:purple acid phosphatase family protein n=1 Tax=Roseibacillus persicicus TaxID=454148 RepID=UPI00398A6E1D
MRLAFPLFLSCFSLTAAEITRGPYLQLGHSEGMTIVWRTQGEMEAPVVRYWQEGHAATSCSGRSILTRGQKSLSAIPEGQLQFEATLTGLQPDHTYQYAIFDGDQRLTPDDASYQLQTHPLIGEERDTRVWVVGDSGTGQIHQRKVHSAMLAYTAESPLDLYLHVGDMAYGQGTDPQFQSRFFEPYQVTLQSIGCWAALGNHEGKSSNGRKGVGPFFDAYVNPTQGESGGIPSGNESYYSFDYGTAHFICLNSYDVDRSEKGKMAQWLKRDLAATGAKWIIGFWHHPPYTKGTHDSDIEIELIEMRESIMPILEAGGVDLVLSGHSHIYERSMLIDKAYHTPTTADGVVLDDGNGHPIGDGAYQKPGEVTPHKGTVAIVTGHGGALGRNSRGVMPIMRSIVLDHGSTILDISGDTLDAVMIDLNGKERDRFQIKKEGQVSHEVIANPRVATRETEERTGAGVLGAPATREAARLAKLEGEKSIPQPLPKKFTPLIPRNDEWSYLAHDQKPETEMWTRVGFDAAEEGWAKGPAGFGYGDSDDRTVFKDMAKKYTEVYIRKEFEIPKGTNLAKLGLAINFDDGFILHINGHQAISRSVRRSPNGKFTIASHEASGFEYYSLKEFAQHFVIGQNVIAIEGFNVSLTSSDFSLDPYLIEDLTAN